MSVPPTVTIILPCYNLAAHIGAAIQSVRSQTFTDFEALVIDDGSTDSTAQAAQAAIAGDPRFTLLTTPHQGLSVARNTGLDAARGTVIAFLDGDDTYSPTFLHAHIAELTQSGADWTASALRLVWPDGRASDHSALHGAPECEGTARWIALDDARDVARLFPSVWNKLYTRNLIGDTRFIPGALFEDHPFFWTLACKARRIRYLPQPLYTYTRGRAGQITDLADEAMFHQLARLREVADILRATPLSHARTGLSRLATRVIHERLSLPAPAPLSQRFLSDAAQWMAQEGLHWDRAGAPEISLTPAPQLDPDMRLSVLIFAPAHTDLTPTLHALSAQDLPLWDVTCVTDTATGMIATLLAHLPDASGAWLACLRAGDTPAKNWASSCLEAARMAACVIAGAQQGETGGSTTGMAQPDPPLAAPDPAMLLLNKRALDHLPRSLRDELAALPDPVAAASLAAHLSGALHVTAAPLLVTGPRVFC